MFKKTITLEEAKRKTLKFLEIKDFHSAIRIVAEYERELDAKRGAGFWVPRNPKSAYIALCEIFSTPQKPLRGLSIDLLRPLQISAAMLFLWGGDFTAWLPGGFQTDLPYQNYALVNMLINKGSNQRSLAEFRESGVVSRVKICAAADSCPECKKVSGREYKLSDPLPLPHEDCTSVMGCRCVYSPIVE